MWIHDFGGVMQVEVVLLGQLRHAHLVKLIGYCCEDEHMLLVYEFVARGSLEKHLYKSMPNSTASCSFFLHLNNISSSTLLHVYK